MATELAQLVVKLAADISEFESGMGKADGSLEKIGGKVKSLGMVVASGAAAAGGALIALGVTSIGVASDFEAQMALMSVAVDPVQVGAKDAAGAMDILGDAALAVGSDTQLVGVSASGAAEAILGLYKAGLSTSEIFGDLQGYLSGTSDLSGALRASIDLAAASELDMVAASELAAVTLATFGGELKTSEERADFVNRAMNNFVQTADASVASVQSLADAFVNVGPTAYAMGMGVEQVNTALGIMSMRGIQGAEAGTQLKSMLLGMQKDAAKAGGAMEQLGVSLYDLDGSMRPLQDVIGDLEAAMAGMTDQQRNQYVTTIAGTYGMNAMNALLAEGAEGWANMEDAIANAATMQETAAARANTFQGAMEVLGGAVETTRIAIGMALLPILAMLARMGADLLERYGPALTGKFEAFTAVVMGVATAVGNFISRLQNGMPALGNIVGLVMELSGAFGVTGEAGAQFGMAVNRILNGGLGDLIQRVGEAITSFFSWKDVVVALAIAAGTFLIPVIWAVVAPILSVVATAMVLVAAVALLRNAWESNFLGIRDVTAAVLGWLQETVTAVVTAVVGWWNANWPAIQATIAAVWAGVQATVTAVVGWIQATVPAVIGGVVAWWNGTWPTIQATIEMVWGVIQAVIGAAVEAIRPTVAGMVESIRGSLAQVDPIVEQLKAAWASLRPAFEAIMPVVQVVGAVIGGALLLLVGVVVGVVNGIVSALGDLIAMVMGVAEGWLQTFNGLTTFLTGFWNVVVGMFTGNEELIQQGTQRLAAGLEGIWNGIVTGITAAVTGLVNVVWSLISGFITGIADLFTRLYQTLVGGSIVPDMVRGIIEWFVNLVQSVTTTVQAFVGVFVGVWNAFLNSVGQLWKGAWDGVIDKFIAVKGAVIWLAGVAVKGVFEAFNQDWGSIGRGIVDGIGNALSNGLRWVADQARRIAEAALDAAKRALGIGSPSKEFGWLGQMSVEGYVRPWRDVRPIEGAVVRAMDAGVNAGQRSVTQTIDQGITIGQVNLPGGSSGLSIIRQFEAIGARR